jgi:hypothetical protein
MIKRSDAEKRLKQPTMAAIDLVQDFPPAGPAVSPDRKLFDVCVVQGDSIFTVFQS